jgi:hypothetical protein
MRKPHSHEEGMGYINATIIIDFWRRIAIKSKSQNLFHNASELVVADDSL